MKAFFLTLLCASLFSSCVSIRFPAEIKVLIEVPAHMTEEQVDQLMAKIPLAIGQDKIRTEIKFDIKKTTSDEENQ